jgi:hypothetical protein
MTFANENVLFLNLPSIDKYKFLLFYNDFLQLLLLLFYQYIFVHLKIMNCPTQVFGTNVVVLNIVGWNMNKVCIKKVKLDPTNVRFSHIGINYLIN